MKANVVYFLAGVAVAAFAFSLWLFLNPPEPPMVMSTPIRHAPPAPPAKADAATAAGEATSEASPPKDVLAAIREADRIADPMERCVAVPPPRNYHWSKAAIEAFCADELTPALPWDEFKDAIDDDRVAEVDERFDTLVEGYFSGRVPEGALRHAYNDNFWGSSTERKRLIDHWLDKAPASAHALAARGMWWLANAEQARGEKLISETPEKDISRMENALGKAKRDLAKALETNPRIMPAYSALIFATKFDRDDALAESTLQKAIAVSPENFYPRAALAYAKRPQWGGSYETMDRIATEAEPYVAKNPRLANLKAIAVGERAMPIYWSKNYAEALRQFDKGLAYGPEWFYLDTARYAAMSAGDNVHAIELLSQMLRFSPWAAEQRRERARLLSNVGRADWAQEDLDVVLRVMPRDTATMQSYASLLIRKNDDEGAERKLKQLIAADPYNHWANASLAWLYVHHLHRYDAAAAILDPMLKREPESGELWLLRVQMFDANGEGPGMREAIESFLRYADPKNRDQQVAIPVAKKWLASHQR